MTTPELTRSSRYESAAGVSTGIRISLVLGCALALLIVLFLRCAVVHLDLGLGFQGAQCLVAADHNFVAGLQALGNFDVRDASDSRLHRPEYGLLRVDHEYTLHFILLGIAGCGRRWRRQRYARTALILCILGGFFQILSRPHGQRLNRYGHDVLSFCSL